MPNQTSARITLSERVRSLVAALARQRSAEYRQVQRAELLLAMAAGVGNNALARTHDVDRGVVRKWRTRWVELARTLAHIETTEATDTQLSALLVAGLRDLPRSGTPATFSAEQIVQVLALSCEDPQASGRPVTHWTPLELADEVVKRGLAARHSRLPSGVFFNQIDLDLHHTAGWLKAPQRQTPEFDAQVKTVCELYAAAPQLHAQGVHVVSMDEKSGIQALERVVPTKPAQPGVAGQAGRCARQEYEYIRHGTQCLIAITKWRRANNSHPRLALRAPKWISSTTSPTR
jgi:hypothetical protein